VVGDKYKNINICDGFLTLTFWDLLQQLQTGVDPSGCTYLVGQGLCKERIEQLKVMGIVFANGIVQPDSKKKYTSIFQGTS
jgi:hypothetical protein